MTELPHLDQVRKTDAMICRAQELGYMRRTSVTLRRKFVEERRPDVCAGQHALFAGCRRFQTPFCQFLSECWAGGKCVGSCAYAVSNDTLNRERACITTHDK